MFNYAFYWAQLGFQLFYSSDEQVALFKTGTSSIPFFLYLLGHSSPCMYVFPLFIRDRGGLSVFLLIKWWLCQLSLLYFCGDLYLSSVVLSLLWNEQSCFWHWVDKWWYHSRRVFLSNTMRAEIVINLTLKFIYILEQLLLVWGPLSLQARSSSNIQVII